MDFEIYANATHLFAHRGPRVRVSQCYHTQTLHGRYLTRAQEAIISRMCTRTDLREISERNKKLEGQNFLRKKYTL